MRTLLPAGRGLATLLCFGLALGLAACDDDDDGPSYDYYVDVGVGDDEGPGSKGSPFATITRALAAAGPGQSVKARPGRYDAASGETFPLRVPEGVELLGDPDRRGEGTVIEGGAPSPVVTFSTDPSVTMVLADDTTVAGFTVLNEAPGNRIGIHVDGESVTLHHLTVRDIQVASGATSAVAIVTTSGSEHRLLDNLVTGNARGIILFRGGDRTLLQRNIVVGNVEGVTTTDEPYYYDFGGGELGSRGGNVFSCNEMWDVAVWYGNVVDLQDNAWDHAPPVAGQGQEMDILSFRDHSNPGNPVPEAVIDVSGARVAPEACP